MFSQIKKITKMAKKEVINKVITSLFIQGLALVIPVFWSKTITEVTDANYKVGYYLIIITLLLSLFYYLWSYLNQKTWYTLYNKIYIEYTNATISETKNINKINAEVILFQSGRDDLVGERGIRKFIKRCNKAKLIKFNNAKHEIYLENNDILEKYLDIIFQFLEK